MDRPLPTDNLGSPYDPLHGYPPIVGDGGLLPLVGRELLLEEMAHLTEKLAHARKHTALEIVGFLEVMNLKTAASLIRSNYGLPQKLVE